MYRSLGYQYLTYLTAEGKRIRRSMRRRWKASSRQSGITAIAMQERKQKRMSTGKTVWQKTSCGNWMHWMPRKHRCDGDLRRGPYSAGWNELRGRYGALYGESALSEIWRADRLQRPEDQLKGSARRNDARHGRKTLTIAGKTYTAIYLGEEDIAAWQAKRQAGDSGG